MQNITLRLGQKGDARTKIDVHRRAIHEIASNDYPPEILNSWGRILSKEDLRRREKIHNARIEKGNDIFVVAEINDKIVGFGEIVVDTNELTAMYINPDFQRQGIATLILKRLEAIAKEKGLKYLHLSSSLTAVSIKKMDLV